VVVRFVDSVGIVDDQFFNLVQIRNPYSGLGQTQICGRVKPVIGIQPSSRHDTSGNADINKQNINGTDSRFPQNTTHNQKHE
jgi:hypothetical protein